jgi:Tol biopolymer transport system component
VTVTRPRLGATFVALVLAGCQATVAPRPSPAETFAATETRGATRIVHSGLVPVTIGAPISLEDLSGRIVTDNFEDVFAMDPDGSNLVYLADNPAGSEFDGDWSPDGRFIVYRDSTRGMNVDDEVYVVRADGTGTRNLSDHPANDWGPAWSPDGSTIVFNSDRDGGLLRGYFVDPDGSNLRPVGVEQWFEYPSWSPDGSRIVFEGALGATYDIFTLEIATREVTRLTDAPGDDSWAVWSPDGSSIAFSSERDDCSLAPPIDECWDDGAPNDHHRAIWLMNPDGSNQRRVTPEAGQFVAFSPDGEYLLISGRALYVVRPDGTGRLELRADGIPLALGGIPDWTAAIP